MDTNFQVLGHRHAASHPIERRATTRRQTGIPGRIIWHDSQGTPRFSSVVTRDISDQAAYVECLSGPPIPLHRLVYLQMDRTLSMSESLPAPFRQGKVLSAVYRVGPVSDVTGLPDGYALRLLVEPRQQAASMPGALPRAAASLALPA